MVTALPLEHVGGGSSRGTLRTGSVATSAGRPAPAFRRAMRGPISVSTRLSKAKLCARPRSFRVDSFTNSARGGVLAVQTIAV
jgi:hypothetical protein